MTPFETIVSELATATGLAIQVDAQDSFALVTDGLVVTVQYRRDSDDVVLFAPLDSGKEDISPAQMRKALELACHGKGTRGNFLGLFDGALILSRFVPFEGLTSQKLGSLIIAFADAAIAVESALSEDEGGNGAKHAESPAPSSLPFLRV